jgi:dihydroxy-acid dehydratase
MDIIEIDIPARSVNVLLPQGELEKRKQKKAKEGYKPASRNRQISKALQAYASMVTSADTGAVRELK